MTTQFNVQIVKMVADDSGKMVHSQYGNFTGDVHDSARFLADMAKRVKREAALK